ncbi:hypothetical protein ACQKM2_40625 [Streptomyces sp. NPDC004126]|uniref:hypothetical protein n=1 Tax=Streptomyces sp. NPDC004126 TaxID=3390695 RepID=UPI003D0340BA
MTEQQQVFWVAHTGAADSAKGVSAVDPVTGRVLTTIATGEAEVKGLVAAPDAGRLFVSVVDGTETRVVDTTLLAVTGAFDSEADTNALAASGDGRLLYSGYVGEGTGIAEVDAATGTTLRRFATALPQQVQLSQDGKRVYFWEQDPDLVGGLAGYLQVLEVSSGDVVTSPVIGRLLGEHGSLSPDGSRLYTITVDGLVQALDAVSLEPVGGPGSTAVSAGVVSPDGERLFAVGPDGVLLVLDARTLAAIAVPAGQDGLPPAPALMAYEPSGNRAAFIPYHVAELLIGTPGEPGSQQVALPGDAVSVVTGPIAQAMATRLEVQSTHPLVPVQVPGLAIRLTTADGSPIAGQTVTLTSSGGLHLGTVTTKADGRAEHTAELRLPINPDTGQIDTSRLTGPYTATYDGAPSYGKAETAGEITLGS